MMHLKIPSLLQINDSSSSNSETNLNMSGETVGNGCTSIYISQPPTTINQCTQLVNQNANIIQIENSESGAQQQPILTIQVNQEDNRENSVSSSSVVNIVSCFRGAATTPVKGSENSIEKHNKVNHNVSVHNNNKSNVEKIEINDEESVKKNCKINRNNSNNRNVISISSVKPMSSEDLNEICVDQIYSNTAAAVEDNVHVDYQNLDKTELIETDKIVITTGSSATPPSTPNQIVVESHTNPQSNGNEQSESANKSKNQSNNSVSHVSESQMSREQRRRERRERRQARNRAQHVHVPVHQRPPQNNGSNANSVNPGLAMGHGHLRMNYEILPDIINNHLPPPYTTLPLPPPPPPMVPSIISPVPVDDCRFSFPIPVIRR